MSEEETVTPDLPEPVRGPSAVLAEAREKLGLSQKEVADRLFLTTSFIQYIDDSEFDKFPKPAFVKGYLRSYARVVELSGDLMVELYEKEQQLAEPTPEMRGVTEEKVGTASITGPVLQTGIIGLILLLVVIALIWWLVSDADEDATPPRVSQSTQQDASSGFAQEFEAEPVTNMMSYTESEPAADEPGDSLSVDAEAAAEDELAETPIDMIDQSSISAVEEPVEEVFEASRMNAGSTEVASVETVRRGTQAISIQRNADGDRNFITVDAGGFEQIDLSFQDECWVEVVDGQQGLIYHDLNTADDILTLYGTAPFKVLLGKATGVEMIYNGRPFDLQPYIGQDKTAKLTVSE